MDNISIAIEITEKAFLPEAYAYRKYFRDRGHICDFVERFSVDVLAYDAIVLFHGFHPFWRKYPKLVIGEYHSLSTGRYSRIKDLIKRVFNVRSDFYIFLNEVVRDKYWHSRTTAYVIRGMGYDDGDFLGFKSEPRKYDLVYSGSIREGLTDKVEYLASLGFKIALVGFDYDAKSANIISFGRKSPKEARRIISQSRFGLNYTPDIFPLNVQDSTKVIEYCGAGLGVITNRYEWVNRFERERGGRFLDLTSITDMDCVLNFEFVVPDVADLRWDNLAERVYAEMTKRLTQ